MARVPHGFWLANLALVWAAFFTAWAMFGSAYSSGDSVLEENPDATWARRAATLLAWLLVAFAIALVAAAALTPVAGS
jgi:hypothetical protein